MAVATKFWTLAELVEKIERDLDLEAELFIQPEELVGYINEAIDEAEAEVHTIYEDYFLTSRDLTLISGTSSYSVPTDLYAMKLRDLTYRNGSLAYTIPRLRDWKKFGEYALDLVGGPQSSSLYRYFLTNPSPGVRYITFTPEVQESGNYVKIWYLRQANNLVNDSDVMDIPEGANFVLQHAKKRCYEKEGHPNLALALSDLERERILLQGLLTTMVPDNDNEIEADFSAYEGMN